MVSLKRDQLIIWISTFFLLIVLYLLFTGKSWIDLRSNSSQPVIGKSIQVLEDVRRKHSTSYVWDPLFNKDSVHEGDSVFTGPDSYTTILLNDGTEISVSPNSLIVLTKNSSSEFELDLQFGSFDGQLAKNSKITLGTEKFTLGNAGKVSVKRPKSGKAAIKAIKEQIRLTNQDGIKTIAPQAVLETKELPLPFFEPPPVLALELISPAENQIFTTTLDVTGKTIGGNKVGFEWKGPKEHGINFTLLIEGSEKPIEKVKLKGNTTQVELNPGVYTVKIKGDQLGQWSSPKTFVVNQGARPALVAPQLLSKNETVIVYTNNIKDQEQVSKLPPVRWGEVKDSKSYTFEISKDETFSELESIPTTTNSIRAPFKEPGIYYYRTRANTVDGKPGETSRSAKLIYKVNPPRLDQIKNISIKSDIIDAEPTPQKINIFWTNLPFAKSYQVELSNDTEFRNSKTAIFSNSAGVIDITEPGTYYTRVTPMNRLGSMTGPSNVVSFSYEFLSPIFKPALLEPENKYSLLFEKPEQRIIWLKWQTVKSAQGYEIEISKNSKFTEQVVRKKSNTAKLKVVDFSTSGKFFWRVRSVGRAGDASDWSTFREFRVMKAASQW